MAEIRLRLVVTGRVQGVSFRASTAEEAERIGRLKGFVRNLADGSVEIVVQGEPADVGALVAWARRGPRAARVDGVKEEKLAPAPGLPDFTITK
jgi:acylphosphatase